MLCLLMGSSYALNVFYIDQHLTTAYSYSVTNTTLLVLCIYAASMSGSIIFITSLLNDLGDVEGDKAFGRRTIPVKLGKKNAVIMTIIIAVIMVVISWTFYYWTPRSIGIVCPILVSAVAIVATAKMAGILTHLTDISWTFYYWTPRSIGIVCPILVSAVAIVATAKMAGILTHLTDSKFIRKQHKKSILWHLMLQASLIVGATLIWI